MSLKPLCRGFSRFAEIHQSILETAKSLVDNTKALVNSAASSQEALAEAAQETVKTISKEVDYVKLGAAALSSDYIQGQVRGGVGDCSQLPNEQWSLNLLCLTSIFIFAAAAVDGC